MRYATLVMALPLAIIMICGAMVLPHTAAAEDSCTGCYDQPNGCCEAVCVDDNGRQYCLQCCPGQECTKTSCR